MTQNRVKEKKFANSLGIPTVPFIEITASNIRDIDSCFFPGILKTARFGYDGKGQVHIEEKSELLRNIKHLTNSQYIFEKKIQLDTELSIIIVRDKDGNIALTHWPKTVMRTEYLLKVLCLQTFLLMFIN